MRCLRDEHNVALSIFAVAVIGLEELECDELSLGTGKWLGGDGWESGYCFKPFLGFKEDLEAALHMSFRGLGVALRKTLESSGPVIEVWVILHGT